MPTIKYSCNVCGKVHDNEEEANLCENSHPKLTFVKATDYNVVFEDDNKAYPRHILCTTETGDTLIYNYSSFLESETPKKVTDDIEGMIKARSEINHIYYMLNILKKADKEFSEYNIIPTEYGDMYCRYNNEKKRKEFIFFNENDIDLYTLTDELYTPEKCDINNPQLNIFKTITDERRKSLADNDVVSKIIDSKVTESQELMDMTPDHCKDIFNIIKDAERSFVDYNIISTGYGDMYCRYNKEEKRKEFVFFNDDGILVYFHSTPNLYSCTKYELNNPQLNGFKNTADGIRAQNLNNDVTFQLLTAKQ